MVWVFERGAETAVLEVRRHDTQFEFVLKQAGSADRVEVLSTPAALIARLEKVPDTLFVEGWRPVGNAPQVC